MTSDFHEICLLPNPPPMYCLITRTCRSGRPSFFATSSRTVKTDCVESGFDAISLHRPGGSGEEAWSTGAAGAGDQAIHGRRVRQQADFVEVGCHCRAALEGVGVPGSIDARPRG